MMAAAIPYLHSRYRSDAYRLRFLNTFRVVETIKKSSLKQESLIGLPRTKTEDDVH